MPSIFTLLEVQLYMSFTALGIGYFLVVWPGIKDLSIKIMEDENWKKAIEISLRQA